MKSCLLGIDIGTSACKAAVFDADGRVLASASGGYPTYYARPGWAEQNPDEWWDTLCGVLRSLFAAGTACAQDIAGVGVAGQSWAAVPIDRNGRVLCNTPIWFDTRAAGICGRWRGSIGEDALFALCGNPLQPGYTLPKIGWYRENAPDIYRAADKILQSNSFIAFKLTGAISHDLSQGYGCHCFDIRKGMWDEAVCRELGIDPRLLPPLCVSHEAVGIVTASAARETGLRLGTPVVAGGLDAACAALGAGVLSPGQTQEQGGQAGGMSVCTSECVADKRLICGFHVIPNRWLLQGGATGGGGVIRWLQEELWPGMDYRALDGEAASVPPGGGGLVFLPYMAGERSPIWDPAAKGVYFGLDFSKTRGHLIRAALEGVAFSLRHNLEAAEQAGASAGRLRAVGGAAKSPLWTRIKADITGKPIDVPGCGGSDGILRGLATELGAAVLAGIAAGVYRDFGEAVEKTVRLTGSYEPNAENAEVYQKTYETYLALYENLKPLMQAGI